MEFSNLEDIIRYHIMLPPNPNSKGFFSVLCKVCNDHGKKGLRAGFKFENSGTVGYHCFNCGMKAKYDPSVHHGLSANMKTVLNDFGVPEEDYKSLSLKRLRENVSKDDKNNTATTSDKHLELEPQHLSTPKDFYKLGSKKDDIWSEIAFEYLKIRNFNVNDYIFFLSTKKYWIGYLIIPIYKNERLIFFEGRKMHESIPGPKYKATSAPRDCVFFNYDEIFKYNDTPLYIVEGFFDAWLINGVAILGNDFTPQQIEILNKSPRKKIYIPDKLGKGYIAATQALDQGWSVSLPDIGSCKDLDDAVTRYGKLFVLKSIIDNEYSNDLGRYRLKLYCDDKKGSKK